ncbi:hypothetical protein NDU88_002518 [Pleurodeles waltl]|uniref:Uncharacterized protein n=1 Tax=Pleurodeles waltl TaxID=8319 RepID=A0AAV7UAT4_PLEWA|nr:hypothetical protein NDU88_002518 [Pleurodeles waltl]
MIVRAAWAESTPSPALERAEGDPTIMSLGEESRGSGTECCCHWKKALGVGAWGAQGLGLRADRATDPPLNEA